MPTLPNQGSNIDWTTAGFTFIGTKADSEADQCLQADSVTRGFEVLYTPVQCDTGGAPEDHVVSRIAALPFEFLVYNARDDLLALASNLSTAGSVTDGTYTTTKRTVVVEINGQQSCYYPQAIVRITEMDGAVAAEDPTAGNSYKVEILPEGTSAIPAGVQIHEYQPAA
jgi:hypothetical protein